MPKPAKEQVDDMTRFETSLEELKLKAEAISLAVTELRKTGIRESVLVHIVQKAAQKHMPRNSVVNTTEVKAVLDGIAGLDKYLFPKKK